MDEGMGVSGGAVEQIFGSHPTSALLIQPSERPLFRNVDLFSGAALHAHPRAVYPEMNPLFFGQIRQVLAIEGRKR